MNFFFKDFATPSLNDVADDDAEETAVVQLSLRRHWETRYDFKTL